MNSDRAGSLFWLCIAVVVAVASFQMGLGSIRTPSIGFMPFGASVLLGLLSIVSFFQVKERTEKATPFFRGTFWIRVILVFLSLLAYAQMIPLLGYNITTFLLMTSFSGLWSGRRRGKL
jgi:hypothetical protein